MATQASDATTRAEGLSIATAMAVTAPLSALVLVFARRPYREALARIDL